MTKLIVAFRYFATETKNGINRKRKPSAVLHSVYTKRTYIIISVEILTEMESFQPLRGWRMLFKRISKIGLKEAKLKYLAHDRDPPWAFLERS